MQQALFTSASDRWFTPPDLLAAVASFFGDDYEDPCPARVPGQPIESGFWKLWQGKVFCNPPYGRSISRWVAKGLNDPVDEIILLIPARTDTAWFQPCFEHRICFIRGRLKFSGATVNAPFPSALVYRGSRSAEFADRFRAWGTIVLGAI